jgi:hypothetical protein
MEKNLSHATFSTTDPTSTSLGVSLDFCHEKPLTAHLHCGMALKFILLDILSH